MGCARFLRHPASESNGAVVAPLAPDWGNVPPLPIADRHHPFLHSKLKVKPKQVKAKRNETCQHKPNTPNKNNVTTTRTHHNHHNKTKTKESPHPTPPHPTPPALFLFISRGQCACVGGGRPTYPCPAASWPPRSWGARAEDSTDRCRKVSNPSFRLLRISAPSKKQKKLEKKP